MKSKRAWDGLGWFVLLFLVLGKAGDVWGSGRIEWEIEIVGAEIKKTKANGKKWDWGVFWKQAPDPYLVMEGGGYKFETQVRSDTFQPRWGNKIVFVVPEDARIHIRVIDKDQRFDDLIGQMDAKMKELEVKAKWSFGQVAWLHLKVKRKHNTPLAWMNVLIKKLENLQLSQHQKSSLLALGQRYDQLYAKTQTQKEEAAARLSVQLRAKYRDAQKIDELQKEMHRLEAALLTLWQSMRAEIQKLLRPDQWKNR
jgi:hypothetical protein